MKVKLDIEILNKNELIREIEYFIENGTFTTEEEAKQYFMNNLKYEIKMIKNGGYAD